MRDFISKGFIHRSLLQLCHSPELRRAGAGIQVGTFFPDTRLRGCDGRNDSSDTL